VQWQEMTLNPTERDSVDRYKENIRRVSQLLKDQIDNPLDRAVYWLEYVIRHKGAHHLLTSARHLSLLQQGLVDVMLLVVASVALLSFASYRSYRYLTSRRTLKLKQS
jgi:glucuronosyltransferase